MTRTELEKHANEFYSKIPRPPDPAGWTHDIASGLSTWTPCMYRLLGLPVGDGRPPKGLGFSLYSPESQAVIEAVTAVAYKQDGGCYSVPANIRHSAGHYIFVRVRAHVSSVAGIPSLVTGTMELIQGHERLVANAPPPLS